MAVTDWLFVSGVGVFFGLIWSWFWITGRIYQHPEYYEEDSPQWLRLVAGKPKTNYRFSKRFAYTYPKAISAVGLIGSLVAFHAYVVFPRVNKGTMTFAQAETSFTLFLVLTWIAFVLMAERSLRQMRSRRDKNGENN